MKNDGSFVGSAPYDKACFCAADHMPAGGWLAEQFGERRHCLLQVGNRLIKLVHIDVFQNFRCFLNGFQAASSFGGQLIHTGEQRGNIRLGQL